ncbi:MAG: hypothetical protein K2W82_15080 [Candidatus Obscuribacterales bacterium]|nr:hypothetical protein [Candidatus Obscuribacterales bacterium]
MAGAATIEEKVLPQKNSLSSGSFSRHEPKEAYESLLADRAVRFPHFLTDISFWHLISSLSVFLFSSFWSEKFSTKMTKQEKERQQAVAFKRLLIDLGPTYIKLGQFLSVRRDILPVVFADELGSLQDKVPPFDSNSVRRLVVQELGSLPEELFASFDPQPLASASIGQVHRIQLKDGRQAVLKVQRPNLIRGFYRDLGLIRLAAKAGLAWNRLRKKALGFDFQNWLEMSDEFGRSLFSEVDYLLEGRNADRLRRLLRDRPEIRIPRVIWKYSARKVLVLEYLEGIKIDQVSQLEALGIDLEQVGNRLIACYLEQIIIKGFFHADPHAGNLACDQNGNLIIYDFGMAGEISETQRRQLLVCVLAVIKRDTETLVNGLVDLGVVRAGSNLQAVNRALSPFMDYYAGRSIFDLDFRQLERDIDTVVNERSFRLPANLAYILRAGSSLEGIARTLKPEFSFIQAVKPVIKKLVALEGLGNLSTLQGLWQLAFKGIAKRGSANANNQPAPEKPPVKSSSFCRNCVRQSKEVGKIQERIKQICYLGIAYVGLSAGTIFMLDQNHHAAIYFLAGNIILGGIMIGNFVSLLKWKPKSAKPKFVLPGNTERNNAEVACGTENPRR